jgi:PKD repeat protein
MNNTVRDITPPVADAGTTRIIDQNVSILLDGSRSVDNVEITNWTWTFTYGGNPIELHGPSPGFQFDIPGEYNVTLRVTDAVGLWDIDHVVIYVIDKMKPSAIGPGDLIIGLHETVVMEGYRSSDNVAVVNWTWWFVYLGEPVILYGEIAEYRFDRIGEFEVSLYVYDLAGNRGIDVFSVRVIDGVIPAAVAGDDIEVDQGTTVSFNGNGSWDNDRIVVYHWSFEYRGENVLLEGISAEYHFDTSGYFIITLTVTDPSGNSHSDTMNVTVTDEEVPVASAGDDTWINQGEAVTFDASSSSDNVGIVAWEWSCLYAGGIEGSSDETWVFTFHLAGVYRIELYVYDRAGFHDMDEVVVTVYDITPPAASVPATGTVDQGMPFTFNGTGSTDNVGVVDWTWSFVYEADVQVLSGEVSSFTFQIPGDYEVTLTVVDEARNSDSSVLLLHVRDTVPPTIGKIRDMVTRAGEPVVLDASGALDNDRIVEWTWTFEEGGETVVLEGIQVEHTFSEPGEYRVKLTVVDAEGNEAHESFNVQVRGNMTIMVVLILGSLIIGSVAIFLFRNRRQQKAQDP